MTPSTTAPPPPPRRQSLTRPWRLLAFLGLLVLLAHGLLLETLLQRHSTEGLLQPLADPAFDQPLVPQITEPSSTPAPGDTVQPPPSSTAGQVVQARTLTHHEAQATASPPAKQRASRPTPPRRPQAPMAANPTTPADDAAHATAPPPTPDEATAPTGATGDEPAFSPTGPSTAPEPDVSPHPEPQRRTATPIHPPGADATQPTLGYGRSTADPEGAAGDASDAATAAGWPRNTRLTYTLTGQYRGELLGDARVQWQREAGRYQAQVAVNVGLLFGMQMTSQGRITAHRLWPEVYAETRRGKTRQVRMGDQLVVLDQGQTLPRHPQLQDTASQFVQLAQDFERKRQPLAVGHAVPVVLARPGGVDEWWYDVVAQEAVDTALGPVQAFHLKPRPLDNPRGTVTAEMWFAPSLQHLPVRIRLSLNPEVWLDLRLSAVAQSD